MLTIRAATRLKKVVSLFESKSDGERLAALERATSLLEMSGMSWHDIIEQARISGNRETTKQEPEATHKEEPARGKQSWKQPERPDIYTDIPETITGRIHITWDAEKSGMIPGDFVDISVSTPSAVYHGIRLTGEYSHRARKMNGGMAKVIVIKGVLGRYAGQLRRA